MSEVVILATAVLLLELLPSVTTQLGPPPPYELVVLEDSEDPFALECRDSFQFLLENSSFYHAGVPEGEDPCLPASSFGVIYGLTIRPGCDGNYFCGIEYNGGLVLSAPLKLYGMNPHLVIHARFKCWLWHGSMQSCLRPNLSSSVVIQNTGPLYSKILCCPLLICHYTLKYYISPFAHTQYLFVRSVIRTSNSLPSLTKLSPILFLHLNNHWSTFSLILYHFPSL